MSPDMRFICGATHEILRISHCTKAFSWKFHVCWVAQYFPGEMFSFATRPCASGYNAKECPIGISCSYMQTKQEVSCEKSIWWKIFYLQGYIDSKFAMLRRKTCFMHEIKDTVVRDVNIYDLTMLRRELGAFVLIAFDTFHNNFNTSRIYVLFRLNLVSVSRFNPLQ